MKKTLSDERRRRKWKDLWRDYRFEVSKFLNIERLCSLDFSLLFMVSFCRSFEKDVPNLTLQKIVGESLSPAAYMKAMWGMYGC